MLTRQLHSEVYESVLYPRVCTTFIVLRQNPDGWCIRESFVITNACVVFLGGLGCERRHYLFVNSTDNQIIGKLYAGVLMN